jgi:hypothetical protein
MKLKNFEIASSIELQSGDLVWDLHNFADFSGLELSPRDNAALMRWIVPSSASNPWGCVGNRFIGMELHFHNLLFLNVSSRDQELPLSEDTCVSEILKVDPNAQNMELYLRAVLDFSQTFRLAFMFQSGRVIEIESEIVQLVPLTEVGRNS